MFMESSACHEVSKGWLRSLKALMSNGRKWEVMKHNRVHDSWTKKQHVRESLRKSGRHSGTPVLHKALERSLYSGWLCAHSVACVSWPCVRHGHPLSRVSWGHKAPRPLHNWTMASSSCVSYGTALFLCVRVPVCVCTVTGQALSTLLSYTRTAPSILQPPLWTTLCSRVEERGKGGRQNLAQQMCSSIRERELWAPVLLRLTVHFLIDYTSVIPVAAVCLFLSAAWRWNRRCALLLGHAVVSPPPGQLSSIKHTARWNNYMTRHADGFLAAGFSAWILHPSQTS